MKKLALLLPFVVGLSACPEWFPLPCERAAVFCEDGTFVVTDQESCEGYCEVGDVAACLSDEDCDDDQHCVTERNVGFAVMDVDSERRLEGICMPNQCPDLRINCPGEMVDTDGDGCVDSCAPFECMIAQVGCFEDEVAVDLDGDGCAESCEPVYCLHYLPECGEDEVAIDIDGDGCDDLCEGAVCDDVELNCEEGELASDSNGDGCLDSCEPVYCLHYLPECGEDEVGIDLDGDGCDDYCEALTCEDEVLCNEDENEVDSDGDGCTDACSVVYCEGEVTECGDGYEPFDSDEDGCADTCQLHDDQCRAIPTCDGGDQEVSEERCEEECYARSLCGVTIYCLAL